MRNLKIVKIFEDVKLPLKNFENDSGFDLYAHNFKRLYLSDTGIIKEDLKSFSTITMNLNDRLLIGTGFKATVGPEYEIQIRSRSGMALKQGIVVLNSPATIDTDYSEEIGIILVSHSKIPQEIRLGERVAQLVVCSVCLPKIEIVETLSNSSRSGFGSTGKS